MSDNFYEKKELITERVILAEDINLPADINEYKNIKAKFYFNIFTPLLDKSKIQNSSKSAPTISVFNNNTLKPSEYQESNYIDLIIPRYLLFQFKNKIPKGTEFIITNIGLFKIEHFRIIGIYTLDDSEV